MIDLADIDDQADQNEILSLVRGYYEEQAALFQEAGLWDVTEIVWCTLTITPEIVKQKYEKLFKQQWQIGWNLVSNAVSKAGGLYQKNTWTPEKADKIDGINWYDVEVGARILSGSLTYHSMFVIGFNAEDWRCTLDDVYSSTTPQRQPALVQAVMRM
jgi:hypothetical protein